MDTRLNLEDYRTPGVRVFAGRDRGKTVRSKANLDRLDRDGAIVTVVIPEDVFSITSSFFLGMFGDSVRHYGGEAFRKHYLFRGLDLDRVIDDGVREALRRASPLAVV